MTKILFLDCDGTIREPASGAKFINRPDDQRILEGAAEAIAYYHEKNWKIIGMTNQGGVAAGHKTLESALDEQRYTLKLLPEISSIYMCVDFEGEECWRVHSFGEVVHVRSSFLHPNVKGELLYESFRKPGSGMIMLAIDLLKGYRGDCWMVGDREEDALAAAAAEVNFMWADAWRGRFIKGIGTTDLSNRHLSKEVLLKFLAT